MEKINYEGQDANHYAELKKETDKDIEKTGNHEDEVLTRTFEITSGKELAQIINKESARKEKVNIRREKEKIENIKKGINRSVKEIGKIFKEFIINQFKTTDAHTTSYNLLGLVLSDSKSREQIDEYINLYKSHIYKEGDNHFNKKLQKEGIYLYIDNGGDATLCTDADIIKNLSEEELTLSRQYNIIISFGELNKKEYKKNNKTL